jgi:hypothetical protein
MNRSSDYQIIVPKSWNCIEFEGKKIFINENEKLIAFHPPMYIDNIDTFLKYYEISTKEKLVNQIKYALSQKAKTSSEHKIKESKRNEEIENLSTIKKRKQDKSEKTVEKGQKKKKVEMPAEELGIASEELVEIHMVHTNTQYNPLSVKKN